MDLSKEELDEILFSGKIYDPMDDAIVPGQLEKIAIVNKYNKLSDTFVPNDTEHPKDEENSEISE